MRRLYEVYVTTVLVVAESDKEACDIVRQAGVEVSVEDAEPCTRAPWQWVGRLPYGDADDETCDVWAERTRQA